MNTPETKLCELLWRMREEADEAWRNAGHRQSKRDWKLLDEIEGILGPAAWDSLKPTIHITWGDLAICHWTHHPPARWPPTQGAMKITELIIRTPSPDGTGFKFISNPEADWNTATCGACCTRLPVLLCELGSVLDDWSKISTRLKAEHAANASPAP